MKITQAELVALRESIATIDTPAMRAKYIEGRFPRASECKDLDKRYRWDLFWSASGMLRLNNEYSDAHIDTALRQIVPSLEVVA